ncbi:MAG: bifunctional diaminohydroxyphosphoribosylaminopyrimidine deaminase/5-amino-6-(5-phosphoribosylamino)uracil reductase RibD [Planctomycetota bacterium]
MNRLTSPLDPSLARRLLQELGAEARAYRFEVAPNPCVGAAILSGTRIVARGYHRRWGGAHAEVEALEAARATDVAPTDWDTLLVTLEPCSSEGKTPPCVDAILASGIPRVVVGALDPDPRHRGKGIEQLREAGVEVLVDPTVSPLESVAPHFLRWNEYERLRRPRPWTIAKWAQTLTGQLSPPEDVGDGRWITGPTSRAEVHRLRGSVDAIVTGVGTVLEDDPRLTVRPQRVPVPTGRFQPHALPAAATSVRQEGPARVVLDSWLRTPPEARLFEPAGPGELAGPVHIMALPGSDPIRRRALEAAGAHVHSNRGMDRHTLDLRDLWTWLWDQGFRRVMLETGPTLLRSALEREFVDQIRVYTGTVRGGEGESLAAWLTGTKLDERLHRESGEDAVLEAFV